MATHSSILALRISWIEEPGGLDQVTITFTFTNHIMLVIINKPNLVFKHNNHGEARTRLNKIYKG